MRFYNKSGYFIFSMLLIIAMGVFSTTATFSQEEVTPDVATEANQDQSENVDAIMGEIFSQLGHVDLGEQTIFTWWTMDLWAVMAYNDRANADAILGYYMMELILKDHLMFAPINMTGDGSLVKLDNPVVLANDKGVSVFSDDISGSFAGMIPGMMLFPSKDENGAPLIDADTQFITIKAVYSDSGHQKEYNFYLPIEYPDYVDKAKAWVAERRKVPVDQLGEEEAIISILQPKMRMDFKTGVIVAPLTKQVMLDVFLERDDEAINDALMKAGIEGILDKYSFYIALSMDAISGGETNNDFATEAMVVDSNGTTYKLDKDELANVKSSMDVDESKFSFIIVPKVPEDVQHKLVIQKPSTGERSTFEW